jgi:hypothetical protein
VSSEGDHRGWPFAEPRFPLPCDQVVARVCAARDAVATARFGRWSFSDLSAGTQVVCGIFHELIVQELSTLEGWRPGEPKREPDVVAVAEPQASYEVKTSSSMNGIAGNRYSSTLDAYDPDRYYLCVNFDARAFIVFRIRVGFIRREGWQPQRGRGNVAMLKREAVQSLRECYGEFMLDAPPTNIPGFGAKTMMLLQENGVATVRQLLLQMGRLGSVISRAQIEQASAYADRLTEHGVQVPTEEAPGTPTRRLPSGG